MHECVTRHVKVGRDIILRRGVVGGALIFDDDGIWSRLFRGHIRGLD